MKSILINIALGFGIVDLVIGAIILIGLLLLACWYVIDFIRLKIKLFLANRAVRDANHESPVKFMPSDLGAGDWIEFIKNLMKGDLL